MSTLVRLVLALAIGLAACGGGTSTEQPGDADGGDVLVAAAQPLAPSEVVPGRIYRAAREQAERELDADNAKDRLDALEREIEGDRQEER